MKAIYYMWLAILSLGLFLQQRSIKRLQDSQLKLGGYLISSQEHIGEISKALLELLKVEELTK